MRKLDADIIIVGGGVAGTSIARELSRYKIDVILLEKEKELCFGVTKGTHSFIHCGLPDKGTPIMNRTVLEGNYLLGNLAKELNIPFRRIGKLLVVFDDEDIDILKQKFDDGKKAGVPGIKILGRDEVLKIEPNITPKVQGALYTPTTAIISPWELVFALAENAKANNINIMLDTNVKEIHVDEKNIFKLETNKGTLKCRILVNAAGLYSDEIASMVGINKFQMIPIKEERIIIDEAYSSMVTHLVRSPITWDFVSPTIKEINAKQNNNLILGFTVEKVADKTDTRTTPAGYERVVGFAKKVFPFIDPKTIIKSFAGLVPTNTLTNDYIIGPDKDVPNFINAVLGGSGVSASPSVAKMVVSIIRQSGLNLEKKKLFNPERKPIVSFRGLSEKDKDKIISKDKHYGHVVCRCETVTEGEIIEAIRRGARTLDGVKYRTRAGMGRCQGGFCSPRVIKILARELNIPVTEVTKKGGNSRILLYKSKELLRKLNSKGE